MRSEARPSSSSSPRRGSTLGRLGRCPTSEAVLSTSSIISNHSSSVAQLAGQCPLRIARCLASGCLKRTAVHRLPIWNDLDDALLPLQADGDSVAQWSFMIHLHLMLVEPNAIGLGGHRHFLEEAEVEPLLALIARNSWSRLSTRHSALCHPAARVFQHTAASRALADRCGPAAGPRCSRSSFRRLCACRPWRS